MVVEIPMMKHRNGFTLIEVMACLLVIALGLTAAAGLMFYGLHLVRTAHGKTIGMATAMTVLADPSPLKTDPSLTPSGPATSGYLNGLWVVRTESGETSLDTTNKLVAVTVNVDVYGGGNGECYASVTRRLIRRKP